MKFSAVCESALLRRAGAILALLAVVLGVWARMNGLGEAPLAVDEYYLLQSALNIVRTGLPEFPCGGYYVRGVLHQYFTAALLLPNWLTAETAIRLPSLIASLATLAGAFLLARRLGGPIAAFVVVALLAVSLWEVEFARFGRMYALLQACTVFYAIAALDFLETARRRPLWLMIGIGLVAALAHEAGILLLCLTLVAIAVSPARPSIVQVLASLTALWVGTLQSFINFRHFGDDAPYARQLLSSNVVRASDAGVIDFPSLLHAPMAFRVLLLAIALAGTWLAVRAMRVPVPAAEKLRSRILEAGAWLAAFVAVAFQQFLLGALILSCAILLGVLDFRRIIRRDVVVPAFACMALIVGAWVIYVLASDSHAGAGEALGELLRRALRYPDLYWKVGLAWAKIFPVLGLALLVTIAAAAILALLSSANAEAVRYRILLGITLALLIAVGFTFQPASSTRYTYFLYPLLMILFVQGAISIARHLVPAAGAAALAVGATVGIFLLSHDFSWRHLLFITRPEFIFRSAYDLNLSEHFYRHWDYRSVGRVLDARASPDDLVISTAYAVMPFYSRSLDFVYLSDRRIWNVSGCKSTRDLWSNLPLIYDPARLDALIRSSSTPVWLVLPTERYWARTPIEVELLARYRDREIFRSIDGFLTLIHLRSPQ
jgi:hypothetical protein